MGYLATDYWFVSRSFVINCRDYTLSYHELTVNDFVNFLFND